MMVPLTTLRWYRFSAIGTIVDEIMEVGYSADLNRTLNETVYSSYNLSLEEIKIIEQSI